jgi:NAD(P)-dependent dehydrogenase (short-subunit alcohol dehydrogenase family)
MRSRRERSIEPEKPVAGRLEGKIAIVTGAGCVGSGWGNGRAITVRFVEEGARVFAVDVNPNSLDETVERAGAAGAAIRTHQADVAQSSSVKAMVDACQDAFGRIDILVNNVGGSMPGGCVEMPEEVFDQQVAFNLKSVFLTCKHVLPVMQRQQAGAIVNLASTSGIRWAGAADIAYAALEAGVIQLSRSTAMEQAPYGIRVNAVVPGLMHTPLVEARLVQQRGDGDLDRLIRDRLRRIPLGFAGDGRDTANAVVYLVSDEARFVTATEIVVDGGMTARCD